jgi:hypothetical protein
VITEQTFIGTPGAFTVQDSSLVNVIPLVVCREGLEFECIVGVAPGNREVQYSDGEGKLTFLDPFTGNLADDTMRQRVYIKYRF